MANHGKCLLLYKSLLSAGVLGHPDTLNVTPLTFSNENTEDPNVCTFAAIVKRLLELLNVTSEIDTHQDLHTICKDIVKAVTPLDINVIVSDIKMCRGHAVINFLLELCFKISSLQCYEPHIENKKSEPLQLELGDNIDLEPQTESEGEEDWDAPMWPQVPADAWAAETRDTMQTTQVTQALEWKSRCLNMDILQQQQTELLSSVKNTLNIAGQELEEAVSYCLQKGSMLRVDCREELNNLRSCISASSKQSEKNLEAEKLLIELRTKQSNIRDVLRCLQEDIDERSAMVGDYGKVENMREQHTKLVNDVAALNMRISLMQHILIEFSTEDTTLV